MSTFKENINFREYIFEVLLNNETSKTVIMYNVEENDLTQIMRSLEDIGQFIKRHKLFQKPVIELNMRQCYAGNVLDDIASEMTNDIRNTFSKLRIIDVCRFFEYDGWNWRLKAIYGKSLCHL